MIIWCGRNVSKRETRNLEFIREQNVPLHTEGHVTLMCHLNTVFVIGGFWNSTDKLFVPCGKTVGRGHEKGEMCVFSDHKFREHLHIFLYQDFQETVHIVLRKLSLWPLLFVIIMFFSLLCLSSYSSIVRRERVRPTGEMLQDGRLLSFSRGVPNDREWE